LLATIIVTTPSEKKTSKAAIINMNPSHLPKAADTAGAWASSPASPPVLGRTDSYNYWIGGRIVRVCVWTI
jgi:hypothetical protein